MDTKTLNIPDEVRQEIDAFAAEVERLNRGEVGDDDFKRFRLQQGIYGQRQDGEQMVRTKLPAGRMTSDQFLPKNIPTESFTSPHVRISNCIM